ncbi:MAG: SDR family oxidoreductase [Sphingobacteriia bacterium]|nr:SDR family oxidoreductase [Sphingobacteriia bacterium]
MSENPFFKNKNVFITGASSGIGKAAALLLAKKGANIAFTYNSRQEEALTIKKEIENFGVKAFKFNSDFSNITDANIKKLFNNVVDSLGNVHILINNAGTVIRSSSKDVSLELIEKQMRINTYVPILLAKEFINFKLNKNLLEDFRPKIISISSMCSFIYMKYAALYAASKTALTQYMKHLAIEYAEHFDISIISPGLTATGLNQKQREEYPEIWKNRENLVPSKNAYTPEDIAEGILYMLKSKGVQGADWVIGSGAQHLDNRFNYFDYINK